MIDAGVAIARPLFHLHIIMIIELKAKQCKHVSDPANSSKLTRIRQDFVDRSCQIII